jgi:catechol 2,3-dioxygenase-like lactoylglutathione lyase family enzyme
MENILLVVEDLDGAIEFFTELGMELEGRTILEGDYVDRIVGVDGVRSEIAMMRTTDGNGRIELDKFHAPQVVRFETNGAPVNTIGYRRIMFAVDDIEDVVARLQAKGAELIGEVTRIEEPSYLMGYLRGPDGIMIGLAQELT